MCSPSMPLASLVVILATYTGIALGQKESPPSPNITLYPLYNGLYLNESAVFDCTSFRYDYHFWTLDNTPVALVDQSLKPVETQDQEDSRWIYSKLVVPTQLKYNDSKISCVGVSLSRNNNERSADSQLLVQGYPGKVLNFKGTNLTSSKLQFSWSPPYHLPGLQCCKNYHISVVNIDSGDVILNDTNFTDTSVKLDVSSEHLCSVYEVQIFAFNELGRGELMTTKWSLGGFFEANKATVMISYDRQKELNVAVDVRVDGYCLNNLDNITLFVECDSVPEVVRKTDPIFANGTVRDLQHSISTILPQSHHDRTCASDIALENNVDIGGIYFNTHDVQMVTSTVVPGAVCVTCDFLTNSPAKGCVLAVSLIGVDRNIEVSSNITMGERNGCVSSLDRGRYTVRVYDWQAKGERGAQYVFSQVVDIPEPIENNTTSSPISESPANVFGTNEIVGVSVGVPLAVLLIGVVFIIVIVGVVVRKPKKSQPTPGNDEPDGVNKITVQLDLNLFDKQVPSVNNKPHCKELAKILTDVLGEGELIYYINEDFKCVVFKRKE